MQMKEIKIANANVLTRLDQFARVLMLNPHTTSPHPRPNLKFARLKELMADESYKGYPDSYNYTDFSGVSTYGLKKVMGSRFVENAYIGQKKTLIKEKHYFLQRVNNIVPGRWYFDTVAVQPPEYGHTGWQNSKQKPRHSLRFILNSDDGYCIGVDGANKQQLTIKDNNTTSISKNWTCIYNKFDSDGSTWFADRNAGSKARVVIDLSIPVKYKNKIDLFVEYLEQSE